MDLCWHKMERTCDCTEFPASIFYYYSGVNLPIISQMKIGITQRQVAINNIVYDCLEQGWYNLFKHHEVIPIPNLINIDLDIDMLVISGGEFTEDRYATELNCYCYAVKKNIPVLGVCHGAFFLNNLYGGRHKDIAEHHNTVHTIKMDDKMRMVNSYHRIAISALGDNLTAIAYTDDNDVEGFRHIILPVWGLVWHPERMNTPILPLELQELIYG